MSIEVMKLVLKSLDIIKDSCREGRFAHAENEAAIAEHILRQSIEQAEQIQPVAIHQFRVQGCSDWYDGIPDDQDGHGPYEVRTLYTAPPRQPLTEEGHSVLQQSIKDTAELVHSGIKGEA